MSDDGLAGEPLLRRLGSIARTTDGPPAVAYELGRSALAWRTVDSELAELVADSELELALVRGTAPTARLLSFEVGAVTVEVQVSFAGDRCSLIGHVMPAPDDATVRVETGASEVASAALDAHGRFEVVDVRGERLRLRVEAPGTTALTTVWFSR